MLQANVTIRTTDGEVDSIDTPIKEEDDIETVKKSLDSFHAILRQQLLLVGGTLTVPDPVHDRKVSFVAQHVVSLSTQVYEDNL